jgi:PHD/YefM family antitoxin component YafN of YafNO toxin-antitoxin module
VYLLIILHEGKEDIMPTILPISDLRNYTEVLNRVDVDRPVYLTRNGRGSYVISKLDDYDREATAEQLLAEIKKGEESAKSGPAVSVIEVARNLNIKL